MTAPIVILTHLPQDAARASILETFGAAADVRFLPEIPDGDRESVLRAATAVMTYHPIRDLGADELTKLDSCRLIQCLTAGIDYLPLQSMPAYIPVAYNAGAFAEPMAEHVIAMIFAAAKRLRGEHIEMQNGAFNQFEWTREVAGATCGILGYGETGRAVAGLARAVGMRVQAINRSGRTDDDVDFIGTLDDIDTVLAASDFVVITLSLTLKTDGLIDAPALGVMKTDATLINVARGEIVDQDALYAHLVANPAFVAGIDAWWIEPIRHGYFETDHDFLSLPNVIASPHNSAMTDGALAVAAQRGAANVLRLLNGDEPRFIAGDDEKMN